VGTNSIKLLVGSVDESGVITPVLEKSRQTRLGQGFYEHHLLQPEPIAATAETVAKFTALAREHRAQSIRAIATSAAREASNQAELVTAIKQSSGVDLEIISGEQEAEWAYRGVITDPQLGRRKLMILDVGGGSTEIIVGERDRHSFSQSFDFGSVRLLELLRPNDPPTPGDLANCRAWLRAFLDRHIGAALTGAGCHTAADRLLVGTGGTTTILARMERQLTKYDRDKTDGTVLSSAEIHRWMTELWQRSVEQRRQLPGLPPKRADIMPFGVAIYEAVMAYFGFGEVYVSTRGLRYGALLSSSGGQNHLAAPRTRP